MNTLFTFTNKCIDFHAESFSAFNLDSYSKIANIINSYHNQNHTYQASSNSGVDGVLLPQSYGVEHLSEDEIKKKIYIILCEIVGI